MEYCPHCVRPSEGRVCKYCGGLIDWTAAPGQLPVGTLLHGTENRTYLLGAARGQGGFGITYAAMNLINAQRVAVKEYYPIHCALRTSVNQVMPMTGQEQSYHSGINNFLDEAMMLSAVGALPSVVTVIDYFEENGTAYLVMEYVDGVPLHEIINKKGKMSAGELLPKLEALLLDLGILHKAKVIHRDISPDNLILMPDGRLKLLDFGSARSMQDSKSMTVLLKPGFSPVEQYQSRGQGPWTDVYALAGTIYYCLTGVIPPTAADRLDCDKLTSPNSLGANLTSAQEKALLWGLAVQPKARPSDIEQFRLQLFAPGNVPPIRRPIGFPVREATPTRYVPQVPPSSQVGSFSQAGFTPQAGPSYQAGFTPQAGPSSQAGPSYQTGPSFFGPNGQLATWWKELTQSKPKWFPVAIAALASLVLLLLVLIIAIVVVAADGGSDDVLSQSPPAETVSQHSDDQPSFTDCLVYTRSLCRKINGVRDSNAPTMQPDESLIKACMERARELSIRFDNERPNGENWDTILDEYGADYYYAASYIHTISGELSEGIDDSFEEVVDAWAYRQADNNNAYYTHIGYGVYYDVGSNTYYTCSLTKTL